MKLSDIKANPNNPRVIKDDKFRKLVKSIEEFPKMMELRPMVINADNIVLGGNMRLKALKELGYKEVPDSWVKRADELTEEEQRRFIIADNVGFGEHDWEMLANEWDVAELGEWGLDVPNWAAGVEENSMTDDDVDLDGEFDPIGVSKGLTRIVIIHDNIQSAKDWIEENIPTLDYKKKGNDENVILQVNLSSNYGI